MSRNAAQIDEQWARTPTSSDQGIYLQLDRFLRPPQQGYRLPETPMEEFELLGAKIQWKLDGKPFPQQVAHAFTQLLHFAELPIDWDSYGGASLAKEVVPQVLQLIFAAHARGRCADLVPLSSGGVGLRFRNEQNDIEIDVIPGRGVEACVENLQTGEIVEAPELASVEYVQSMLETAL